MTLVIRKLLNTNQAVDYLRTQRGYVTTKSTMETRRCRGGGAAYLRIKGKVYYRQTSLDLWLEVTAIEYLHTDCPAIAAPP